MSALMPKEFPLPTRFLVVTAISVLLVVIGCSSGNSEQEDQSGKMETPPATATVELDVDESQQESQEITDPTSTVAEITLDDSVEPERVSNTPSIETPTPAQETLIQETSTPTPVIATDTPEPLIEPQDEIGYVGSWIGNPVQLGDSHVVDIFNLRILEAERGWEPQDDCCPDGLPPTLLMSDGGETLTGYDAETSAKEVDRGSTGALRFDGEVEYVRIRFEVANVGNPETTSTFDTGHLMLADDQRRVFDSWFFPDVPMSMESTGQAFTDWSSLAAYDRSTREAEVSGGAVEEVMAWLVPKDASGLTLVYFTDWGSRAGFFSLEDSEHPSRIESPPKPLWVEDAIGAHETWMSRPADKGVAAWYADNVLVRVADVATTPSPCRDYWEPIDGYECLHLDLEVVFAKPSDLNEYFDNDEIVFVIDAEAFGESHQFEDGGFVPISPEFDSPLDLAEMNGRGYTKVRYYASIPQDWETGVAIYNPTLWDSYVYLALGDVETWTDSELLVEVGATVTAVGGIDKVGLFEYLDTVGNGLDDFGEDEITALTGTALACAEYVTQSTETTETLVLGAILALSATQIGPAAPGYFDYAESPAAFCGNAFPASSKQLVLVLLAATASYACLFGGQGAFGVTPATAMQMGETLFIYWGEDAPASMSDFDGPEGFCGWLFDENNQDLADLLEATESSFLGQ